MTVKDVYKMGVLGESSPFRDQGIESFSNENFLRFKYQSHNLATKIKIDLKMTTNACSLKDYLNFLMSVFQARKLKKERLTKFLQKY